MTLSKVAISIASSMLMASSAFAACPKGTSNYSEQLGGKNTCVLAGTYTDDLHLTNSNSYIIEGPVFIGADNGKGGAAMVLDTAELLIDAGTQIYALNPLKVNQPRDIKNFLVISRGSKIFARGTKTSPIVFTSIRAVKSGLGAPAPGDWGGLFLNGQAPSNKCGADLASCVLAGEAGTGFYGGNKVEDNSGVLNYVRVEFGGDRINATKEFNGITFNGVGNQTQVEYIQVHNNDDDGVEFFGGTVNVKNLVITGARDDSIDWVEGYVGNIQFAAVVQFADEGDRGIEGDNLKANFDAKPQSMPYISNLTMVGRDKSLALKIRRGSGAMISNSFITGFGQCAEAKEAKDLEIFNNVFACKDASGIAKFADNQIVKATSGMNVFTSFAGGELTDDFSDWFEDVDFIGAVGSDDWTKGWTVGL